MLIVTGLGVSRGVAVGRAHVILSLADREGFLEGSILVTKITDPSMVRLMALSSAIVCDLGGMLSHPSIVSRELGIPCVVATKVGTERIQNGMLVRVDGESGEVTFDGDDSK